MAKSKMLNAILLMVTVLLLLATCDDESNNYFTVSFEAFGGEPEPEVQMVPKGSLIAEPEAMTRSANKFDAWYKDEDCTGLWDFEHDVVTEDITLYAKWNPVSSNGAKGGGRGGGTPSAGATITITTHPNSTTDVIEGGITGSLSVTATVAPSGMLTYQWYNNTAALNAGGSAIPGETGAGFNIPTTITAAGSPYYYYCVVSSAGAASVPSNVATVNVDALPVITVTTQPAATINVTQGAITGSLTVAASVAPAGTVTYQWYSNTTSSNSGGTSIAGATGTSYALPTALIAAGSPYYYYCVVSSTGAASVASNVATVNVGLYTVTFSANGGSGTAPTSQTASAGANITLPLQSALTRTGNVFAGWNTNTIGTGTNYKANSSYTVNGSITLYARWINIDMVSIPAGSFYMGSPDGSGGINGATPEPGRTTGIGIETLHQVTLTAGFSIGRHQVTQGQWVAVMGGLPAYTFSYGSGDRYPIYYVSWYDAIVFCNTLSIMAGLSPAYSISSTTDPTAWGPVPYGSNDLTWDTVTVVSGSTGYRLPTEAQWEYACRAGEQAAFNNGNNDMYNDLLVDLVAWYTFNSGGSSHVVGQKAPNLWGLLDMHGNVYEWCWDWDDLYAGGAQINPTGPSGGTRRMGRGGTWSIMAHASRSAFRMPNPPWLRTFGVGFRLARP